MRPLVRGGGATLALFAFMLLGCGGDDDDSGDTRDRTATAAAETSEDQPAAPAEIEKGLRCSRGRAVARGRSSGAATARVTEVVSGRSGSCLRLRKPSTQGAAVVYQLRCTLADGSKTKTQRGSAVGLSLIRVRSPAEARDDERCRVTAKAYMYSRTVASSVSCGPTGCDISAEARQLATGRLEVAILKPG